MAISKILHMKDSGNSFHARHLKRALDYVMNPEKTQRGRLVGAVNCQADIAFEQMMDTKKQFGKTDKRQGYHIILSFKEDEVEPDRAFEITQKFVAEYLGDAYEAVFVVHDNTDHVHSHIVFNSVSFVDGKKYRYEKGDWAKYIQPITNKLCQEYGLSIIDFLKGMLDYEKSLGKTSMRKLLLKGGDLQVLQFNTEDMKKVEKMAKKYGILYSVLPDCNRKDGLSEVIFHTEAVPRVNMMIQKLKFGKIATFDDYLKNGDEKSLGKLMDFLKKQQGNEKSHTIEGDRVNTAIDGLIEKVGMFAMEKKAISVDQVKENFSINGEQAESVIKQLETIGVLGKKNEDGTHTVMMDKDAFINRVRGYQDLAERMRAVAASKNANLSDVTISKKLIIEENDHAVKTRVPGTWGEEARYVWLRKENIMEIHGGKTMLTFLDSTKDYKLYDEQNRVVTTQKGTELYTHYDKVESSVRERYEKVQKQQKKTTQKKTVTTKKAR